MSNATEDDKTPMAISSVALCATHPNADDAEMSAHDVNAGGVIHLKGTSLSSK